MWRCVLPVLFLLVFSVLGDFTRERIELRSPTKIGVPRLSLADESASCKFGVYIDIDRGPEPTQTFKAIFSFDEDMNMDFWNEGDCLSRARAELQSFGGVDHENATQTAWNDNYEVNCDGPCTDHYAQSFDIDLKNSQGVMRWEVLLCVSIVNFGAEGCPETYSCTVEATAATRSQYLWTLWDTRGTLYAAIVLTVLFVLFALILSGCGIALKLLDNSSCMADTGFELRLCLLPGIVCLVLLFFVFVAAVICWIVASSVWPDWSES